MSDVTISVIQQPSTIINVGVDETLAIGTSMSSTTVNVGVDETTLIQAGTSITPHSFTHVSGGNDEINHNLLNGLQGGSNNEYYHISSEQYVNLTTGSVIRPSQTGQFYPRSNPSGFITGINNIVYTITNQTLDGIKTFSHLPLVNGTGVVLTSETGQFYPRSNPSGYITNISNIVYTTGVQTINGAKTFNSHVTLQDSTNQLRFKTGSAGNTIFINVPNINGNHTYTIPDVGVSSAFVMTDGPQTINGSKTFNIRPTVSGTDVALVSEIINLVFTTGNQKISGIKTFGENNEIVNSTYSHILGGRTNLIANTDYSVIGGGLRNSTSGNYSVLPGGQDNLGSGNHNFIGGGRFNSGFGNYSTIVGGDKNTISGNFSSIGGGTNNNSIANNATVGGGGSNIASGISSTIAGGGSNIAIGISSTIAGGIGNRASSNASTVGGGFNNQSIRDFSTIAGGYGNLVSGSYSTIGGGFSNTTRSSEVFIGGGFSNAIFTSRSFIGGGNNNIISGINGSNSVICGGANNRTNINFSFIGAGLNNIASGSSSFIGAGTDHITSGIYASIVGGNTNQAGGNLSFIGCGGSNIANGNFSFIGGGINNIASGEYSSILGGRKALIEASHSGSTVLADGQDRNHFSKGQQTCSLDFASGVYLRLPSFTGSKDQAGNLGELKVSGEYLYIATGQDTWGRIQISTF